MSRTSLRRALPALAAASATVCGGTTLFSLYAAPPHAERPSLLRGMYRSLVTATAVATMVADYKLFGCGMLPAGLTMDDMHSRNAHRMLRLCAGHGGIYIKGARAQAAYGHVTQDGDNTLKHIPHTAGQHLSSLAHFVPEQYTEVLSQLQDRVRSWQGKRAPCF